MKKKKKDKAAPGLVMLDHRLIEVRCRLAMPKPELPGFARQTVELSFLAGLPGEDAGIRRIVIKYAIKLAYEDKAFDEKDANLPVSIQAMFGIMIHTMGAKIDDEKLKESVAQMAFPYWSEFAKSMSVRMGLPPIPVMQAKLPALTKRNTTVAGF